MKLVDLSYTLDDTCMTCGTAWHEKMRLEKLGTIAEVGRNTHRIIMGSHTGTHMDAPLHFYDGALGIDRVDIEMICGECQVVDMTKKGPGSIVAQRDVGEISVSERMLFRFDWFQYWNTNRFYSEFPYFSMEAAEHLVNNGMRVIALDTPSPDSGNAIGKKNDSPVHKLFLREGVTIIEYLTNTDALEEGKSYRLWAMPLKLKDCDGAPARVMMEEL